MTPAAWVVKKTTGTAWDMEGEGVWLTGTSIIINELVGRGSGSAVGGASKRSTPDGVVKEGVVSMASAGTEECPHVVGIEKWIGIWTTRAEAAFSFGVETAADGIFEAARNVSSTGLTVFRAEPVLRETV